MPRTRPTIYYHFLGTKKEEEQQNSLRNVLGFELQEWPYEYVERNCRAPRLLHLFPWEMTKTITPEDLDPQLGLELNATEVREHLLKHWVDTDQYQLNRGQIVPFTMVDLDTKTEHFVTFRKWPQGQRDRYFVQENWFRDFVWRRNLMIGTTVGMYWDIRTAALRFSVLGRASD